MLRQRLRAAGPALAQLAAATATIAALVHTHPAGASDLTSGRGDDLALAVLWIAAVATAAWLGLVAAAFAGALIRRRPDVAVRVARGMPAFLRPSLLLAVTAWTLAPVAASAATSTSPASPLVVHVGAGGRVVVPGNATDTGAVPVDVPVVRAPAAPVSRGASPTGPRSPAPSTQGAASSAPAPANPPAARPVERRPVAVAPAPPPDAPAAPARAGASAHHVVRRGESLWTIATAEVARVRGGPAADDAVARYWTRVVAANRATLRSGDPSLIFPGEVVALPRP